MLKPLFVTVPHSGEVIPRETPWLQGLKEEVVMCDVDRFVDRLYTPALESLQLPFIIAETHRYAADLNRLESDIDALSVVGGAESPERFSPGIGLHWARTTHGEILMPQPMTQDLHKRLVELYHRPFHKKVNDLFESYLSQGASDIYQLDAHSMPSQGTSAHKDPGQTRAEIVISDYLGKSCAPQFKDLVISAYEEAGLEVAYNTPYIGGRITQRYGQPELGRHCIQVEINRSLYMNETSKQWVKEKGLRLQEKITQALSKIAQGL